MWEYEVITIDYDAQKLGEGLKGHPGMAAVLSTYASRGWEVVAATTIAGSSGPLFVLRRPVDESRDTARGDRTVKE